MWECCLAQARCGSRFEAHRRCHHCIKLWGDTSAVEWDAVGAKTFKTSGQLENNTRISTRGCYQSEFDSRLTAPMIDLNTGHCSNVQPASPRQSVAGSMRRRTGNKTETPESGRIIIISLS